MAPDTCATPVERMRAIVQQSVERLFAQIDGGRVFCESEATLQLHLGRIIALVGDLHITSDGEVFSIELEKPLRGGRAKRGRIDVWFRLRDRSGRDWRCAMELKFFKRANHREPNNRYDVFKDMCRLEEAGDVADLCYMLVATDHLHYVSHAEYSVDTGDFDFRHGSIYRSGKLLTYKTSCEHGPPISLKSDYEFRWIAGSAEIKRLLVEIIPEAIATSANGRG